MTRARGRLSTPARLTCPQTNTQPNVDPLDTYEGLFVGHREPLAWLAHHLPNGSDILWLCGPAGVGKTRLALHSLDA